MEKKLSTFQQTHPKQTFLHLFQQQPGFVDRGHEVNNKETAWVNGFLFRLQNDATAERLSIEEVGSSVDKISALL